MIHIRTVLTIAKKELFAHLDNPASYIAFIVFILFWQFLFFRSVLLVGEASLAILFDYLPWLLLLFASAVTMTAFSQEKSDGTLELLLTHPVSELDVVAGKFISSFLYVTFGLLFAIPVAVTFSLFAPFDWGVFIGQLLSGILLAASLVSLGLFLSFVLGNPIASLLASSVASFFFIILGSDLVTGQVPLAIVPYLERWSLLSHVTSMARGVIGLQDIWYFIAFILTFLSLTYLELLKRKFGNRRDRYARYQLGVFLFIGIAVLTSVIGNRIPGQADLTSDHAFTISSSTKNVLRNLPDIVTITMYASSKLPSQLSPVVRETKDILREYRGLGKGKISVVTKDPSSNTEIAQEAARSGVREVQFNVIGSEEFQVKTGFVGLTVLYGGQHETIPYISSTGDLEYQLTSLIHKLTTKDKPQVAFLSGHGEKSIDTDYRSLGEELSKQFTTQTVVIDPTSTDVATNAAILVVAGPTEPLTGHDQQVIASYIKKGKNALFLVDGYTVSQQLPTAAKNVSNIGEVLTKYGISVNQDLAYDLRSNANIRLGQGDISYVLPYPFWVQALANPGHIITGRISNGMLPWPSSITVNSDVTGKEGYAVTTLLKTSPYSGVQTGDSISIMPNALSLDESNLKEKIVSVSVEGKQSGSPLTGRIVVVGNSEFLTDQMVGNSPQNLAFGVSALSWLSNDQSLSGIKVRQVAPRKLVFRAPYEPTAVKYGNMALGLLLPLLVAGVRIVRRRNLRHHQYSRHVHEQ